MTDPVAAITPPVRSPLYGVDTMLFVYHFEEHPQFGPGASRLLRAAEHDRLRLVTSVLTLMEVLVVPKREGQLQLCQRYRELFASFPQLTVLPIDPPVAEVASDLRATYVLRSPDALHLATAIVAGAEAFVTGDRRLQRISAIRVIGIEKAIN
ncbi:MAG: type II toxin-antitoxin system VapC family toxin [Acidobacteria bacterium]|nr:type II toxin-antitoxin system VapC family toxin [Acidobacteriota bacterium]